MATEFEYALSPKPQPSKDMSANPILANMLNESQAENVFDGLISDWLTLSLFVEPWAVTETGLSGSRNINLKPETYSNLNSVFHLGM